MYIYIYIYMYTCHDYIYIYIDRERCAYIYICIEREMLVHHGTCSSKLHVSREKRIALVNVSVNVFIETIFRYRCI